MKRLLPGEVTRYLGYSFDLHIPQKEKDGKMLSQIRKHLAKWANHPLSLAGRIMVSNKVILSSIWYQASCIDLTGKALKIAKATVRNYIWSGKKESFARARVKWDTTVLPIVRGGIKILDPQWQSSALLIKLLIRGLSVGYEPWKVLVRFRVAQTKQSRRGRWPPHSNWIMNSRHPVRQGSSMWQGVMRAWHTIQSGIEQHGPQSWSEITRQPLFGNRYLTNEMGLQWGTDSHSNMKRWADKGIQSLKALTRAEGHRWRTFDEHTNLRRSSIAPGLYRRLVTSIPWEAQPAPPHSIGQWVAPKEEDGKIRTIYHITNIDPMTADIYRKLDTEQIQLTGTQRPIPQEPLQELRIIQCGGQKRTVLETNPTNTTNTELSLWLWGEEWITNLEWDPKEWQWRRVGILPETIVLNYTTKRGYMIALQQNNHVMKVDAKLAASGFNSKTRRKFFNRIWHPYLPRKVSAM